MVEKGGHQQMNREDGQIKKIKKPSFTKTLTTFDSLIQDKF